jgi:superfamily I DNA/RNA helicase/RecB family exonuclease
MAFRWGTQAGAALDPTARGLLRIVGGPGTGKSSLLIDAAAAQIAAGMSPSSVMMLTGTGKIRIKARSALTSRLLQASADAHHRAVIREPLVRTVHSYAFAVLQTAAHRAGDPPPKLVTSAEQDAVIRELLAGDLEGVPLHKWPEQLRPAVGTAGFAAELRDLLTQCAERSVDPTQLQRLGRLHRRPEWTAAGLFARQYEQVMMLRSAVGLAAPQATVPALGAAELVGAALDALAADPALLAAERDRIRVLLVDDAQQLDPQAARLVRVLAGGANLTLIAGDRDQAVFGFRGGESGALLDDESPVITLTQSHRCSAAVARAVNSVAQRLPGAPGADITGATGEPGSVTTRLAASAHAEALMIADELRRSHLIDGVPWSEMAVIVRSMPRLGGTLVQALARSGVPVVVPPVDGGLSDHPAVHALLTVLAATADGLDGGEALDLLTGPIGRVDPITLRQLRRTLRRAAAEGATASEDHLVTALTAGTPARLPAAQARPVRRVRAVLEAAARSHRHGQDPRYTLWQAWQRSGLQRRWLKASAQGGPAGARAERDLDAVTALFDVADRFVSQTAGASVRALIDYVATLKLPIAGAESPAVERVEVLTPHAALGRQWERVVIAGLQEGLWPNTVPRGGVLGTQRLLDVIEEVGDDASMRAPLLAEERRLLVASMGRARSRLVITAVDGQSAGSGCAAEMPSSFFFDVAACDAGDVTTPASQPVYAPRVLSAPAVVGRLRSVVCAPEGTVDEEVRRCAADQLARLAKAGVPGAKPAEWYGMTPVSTAAPLWSNDDHVVTLTPSSLQTLTDCPLRWLAERHGGAGAPDLRSATGSMLHALIADPDKNESELLAQLERVWRQLPFEAQWFSANELARYRAMIQAFVAWRAQTRRELSEVGVEVDAEGVVDLPSGAGPRVRLRGRADRVERDAAGRLVVVDVKTGKTPVSKDDAQRHAQLAMYQLAIAEGLLPQGDEPGGARLVYLGKTGSGGATEREQDPLTPAARDEWRAALQRAAAATAGPVFAARINDGCAHCPMRPSCPAHDGAEGQRA